MAPNPTHGHHRLFHLSQRLHQQHLRSPLPRRLRHRAPHRTLHSRVSRDQNVRLPNLNPPTHPRTVLQLLRLLQRKCLSLRPDFRHLYHACQTAVLSFRAQTGVQPVPISLRVYEFAGKCMSWRGADIVSMLILTVVNAQSICG